MFTYPGLSMLKDTFYYMQRKVEKLGLEVNQLLHSVEESLNWFQNKGEGFCGRYGN